MPFLRDEGPPISTASIQRYRESLPLEYGWATANETGREVLVVRVPKPKPDYLHDLAEVAFYVGLENVKSARDVLLIGHEKTARLEPQLLRDHIRAQAREDAGVVDHLRRQLDRQYGHTFVTSPSNHQHSAFAVRIPKETVAQFTADDVNAIRQLFASLQARVLDCQYAYIVANADHERLGRRTLLELLGVGPATAAPPPAPAAAAPVVSAPLATAAPVPAAPAAQRTPFPAAPTAAPAAPPTPPPAMPAPPAPAPAARVAPTPRTPSFIAAAMSQPPVTAPSAPAATDLDITDHEEYTIVSKPKAAPPAPPVATPAPAAPAMADPAPSVEPEEEYTIISAPRAPAAPVAAPEPAHDEPAEAEGKQVLHADKEFEVFTSKPKPKADAAKPAITPPGMGGFQAALHGATGPAPARTREYEIMGRTSVTTDATIGSKLRFPGAAPAPAAAFTPPPAPPPMQAAAFPAVAPQPPIAAQPAAPVAQPTPVVAPPAEAVAPIPPRVAPPSASIADSGATIVARVAPAAPELVLAQRFKEAGYEIVEGLRAQGTVFAFAAHRPNGRRVLVKRAESFGPEEAGALAQLVAALGADVALVVADNVRAGTRLATWGTRIEVVTAADVPALAF